MTGQELLEWLQEIPKEEREQAQIVVETGSKWFDELTPKFYACRVVSNRPRVPAIFLIGK